MEREVRYCTSADGTRIAYRVTGSGEPFVWVTDILTSHVQREWDFHATGDLYRAIASRFTLVRFDSRELGLSDRNVEDLSLESRGRDLEAVINALSLERFILGGEVFGAFVAIDYAVRHPERVSKLILQDVFSSGSQLASHPHTGRLGDLLIRDWEMFTENMGALRFGWSEPRAREFARFVREALSQSGAQRSYMAVVRSDVRAILPGITCPTLVISHARDIGIPAEGARDMAALIPGARVRVIDAQWGERPQEVIAAIGDFVGQELDISQLAGPAPAASAPRTVLFTDLVGHSEMMSRLGDKRGRAVLRQHETITREVLKAHGGTEIKTMGDGFMASFASVTRAVECAIALQKAIEERNRGVGVEQPRDDASKSDEIPQVAQPLRARVEPITVRVGLNAGEPIEEEGDLFGATVILASRIAARADGGEILVADTVRGLCSGKGFLFADRGEFVAKGFEEPVRVYEVSWRDG